MPQELLTELSTEYSINGRIYDSNRTVFCIKDLDEIYYFVYNHKQGLSNGEFFISLNVTNDHQSRIKIAKIFISIITGTSGVHEDEADDITFLFDFCDVLKIQEILFENWHRESIENIPSLDNNDCYVELTIK